MPSHPKFGNPPVVETVIAVHFAPLQGFNAAHAGVFWDRFLRPTWKAAKTAPPFPVNVERLDSEGIWRPVTPSFALAAELPDPRLQFIDENEDRMVQVQATGFAYNWRKRGDAYPSFEVLAPEFFRHFNDFCQYLSDERFVPPALTQWEVTYVNFIDKGELWENIADWNRVIPGALAAVEQSRVGELETLNVNCSYLLPDRQGRLRLSIAHAKARSSDAGESIDFRLTARGLVESGDQLGVALGVGHEAIVQTFANLTSGEAHRAWRISR